MNVEIAVGIKADTDAGVVDSRTFNHQGKHNP